MSTNKALVLIDGSNVYFAQKKVGKQLDWVKVLKHLRQTYTLIAVRYYAGLRRGETSADSFHKKLGRIGIQVITKEVKRAVVYSSMKTISWELRKVADELHFIEDNLGLTKDPDFVRL